MKPEDLDLDLRAHFQAQRDVDHQAAPAWRLPTALASIDDQSLIGFRFWVISAAAIMLLLSGVFLMKPNLASQPRLTESLPVLLDQPDEPLFAHLETESLGCP